MGKLIINGTLDVDQFWPDGESDADTTKLIINVAPGTIQYQAPGDTAQPTAVFDGAFVKIYGAHELVIKNNKLTVRLQGLDAPELHVQPQPMKGTKYKGQDLGSLKGTGLVKRYRQRQAETATLRLGEYLDTLGTSPLPCQFVTEVVDDQGPSDAIDKYGRFVGNVLIAGLDLNLKILRHGWAIVALYNSMLRAEIMECLDAWYAGRQNAAGIAKYLTKSIGAFDPALTFRGRDAEVEQEGAQKFIHPKLYRRQCTWWAYHRHGTFNSGYDTFLKLSKHDLFYELNEFLDDGPSAAVQLRIDEMVKSGKEVIYGPDEVVFKEAPSTLFAPDGKKLERWWRSGLGVWL
jgi:endonuclease YncB( thermonuclease family)